MTPRTLFLFLATATTSTILAFTSPHTVASARSSELHQTLLHDAEAGKAASWAGARYGDTFLSTGHYSPSETHGTRSSNAMDSPATTTTTIHNNHRSSHHYTPSTTHARAENLVHTSQWMNGAHVEAGNGALEWSGARRGDYGVIARKASPTASQWLE
ncbi:hypothetical protein ACHAWT_001943 [Skeletonema menzelii]